MADEITRTLFNKVEELKVQTTRIETLLVETVIAHQKEINERLDRHSERMRGIIKRVNALEDDKKGLLSVKKFVLGVMGVAATAITIALGAIQLLK